MAQIKNIIQRSVTSSNATFRLKESSIYTTLINSGDYSIRIQFSNNTTHYVVLKSSQAITFKSIDEDLTHIRHGSSDSKISVIYHDVPLFIGSGNETAELARNDSYTATQQIHTDETGDFNTTSIDIRKYTKGSIVLRCTSFTGISMGVTLGVSNDNTNWGTGSTSFLAFSGTSSQYIKIDLSDLDFGYLRLEFVEDTITDFDITIDWLVKKY
tara:strand:+ start:7918 stop:8556 length:639 start_codon:yes stop_codon:yes gene_type:complete